MNTTNQALKWIVWAGLFLITLTPLFVSSSLLFPFITGKAFFFKIVVDVIFAAYLILAVRDPQYMPKKSWLTYLVFIFLGVVLIADIFGINPHKSFWSNFERMEGFFLILHLALFYLVAGANLVKEQWNYWMNTSIGVSVIVVIYGLFQIAGSIDIRQGADRLDGTLGNASYLAVYMLLNIGFALYLLAQNINKRWAQVTYGLIVLFQLFIIFRTATRGTILGIGIAVLVSSIIYVWKARGDVVGRKIAAGLLLLVLILVGTLYVAKDTAFVQSNTTLSRVASLLSYKSLLNNARAKYIWPIAIKGIQERPILGYGQEGFNYVFNEHYDPKMWTEEAWFDRAHNVFLDWFIAAGILGFGLYIALYVLAFMYIWKGSFHLREKIILIGLLVAYAVHNMTVFDNISSYVLFFAFLAFLHTQHAKERICKGMNINVDIRDLVIIPGIIIVMGATLYFVNIVPMRVSSLIIDALRLNSSEHEKISALYKQALSYNVTGSQEVREQAISLSENFIRNNTAAPAVQQMFFGIAQQAIKEQIEYAPLDARAYLLGGSFLNRLNQFDVAFPLLQKAQELTPNKQSPLFELATNDLNKGRYADAIVHTKKAFDLDPNYPDAQRLYMIALLYADKFTELNAFIKEYPPTQVNEQLLDLFKEKQQYGLIISVYKGLVEKNPKVLNVRVSLAAAQFTGGDRAGAIATLRAAIKDFPEFEKNGNQIISDINLGKSPIQK